jgi:hypothetical protein
MFHQLGIRAPLVRTIFSPSFGSWACAEMSAPWFPHLHYGVSAVVFLGVNQRER